MANSREQKLKYSLSRKVKTCLLNWLKHLKWLKKEKKIQRSKDSVIVGAKRNSKKIKEKSSESSKQRNFNFGELNLNSIISKK